MDSRISKDTRERSRKNLAQSKYVTKIRAWAYVCGNRDGGGVRMRLKVKVDDVLLSKIS